MISLTHILDMKEDKEMAAKWLSENVDLVLADLDRLHNLTMSADLAHSCLEEAVDGEKWQRLWINPTMVERARAILRDMA